jgi:salicylate hydroxylase
VPWVRQYANVAGAELEHWSFEDRVTLLGDAAHTHSAFAAGVGLAIDDAYALGLAFDHVFPPSVAIGAVTPIRIREVFDLYEATRRPHTGKVLAVVHTRPRLKLLIGYKSCLLGSQKPTRMFATASRIVGILRG